VEVEGWKKEGGENWFACGF